MADVVESGSAENLQAEIDRLREENERLRTASTAAPAHKSHRTGWGIVLAIVAAVILALAVPAVWLNRSVLDTNGWVRTVAPLAEEPAIQDYIAQESADLIIANLDAEQRIADLLPDDLNLDRFAPVLADSVESAIRKQTSELVKSPKFAELWNTLNRRGHKALITAVTGRSGVVSVQAGTFTLDVGLLIDRVKMALEDRGLGFVARIPTSSADRQVTLYHSDAIAQLGPIVETIGKLALWLPLLALLSAAGAFGVAIDRRRVALWLGAAIVVAGLLPLQAVYLAQFPFARTLESAAAIPSPAGQAAYDIVFRDLVSAERLIVVLGIVIWFAALLAGPARWAVALRGGARGGLAHVGSGLELGSFGAFVARHIRGLRAIGIVGAIAILLALPAPRTVGQLLGLFVAALVWFALLEIIAGSHTLGGRSKLAETPDLAEKPADVEQLQLIDEPLPDVEEPPVPEPPAEEPPAEMPPAEEPPEDEPPAEEPPPA